MTRRKRTVRRRMLAGPDGSLFITSDGLASAAILDGDEQYGYANKMEARSAWFRARQLSWSHPARPFATPPWSAIAYDGFTCSITRHLPSPQSTTPSWSTKTLTAAARADGLVATAWQRANEALDGIDVYIAELHDLAAALAGVTDEAVAYQRLVALSARADS